MGTVGTAGSTTGAGGKVGWWSRTVSAGQGTAAGGTVDFRDENGKWADVGASGGRAAAYAEEDSNVRGKEEVIVDGQFRAASSVLINERQN